MMGWTATAATILLLLAPLPANAAEIAAVGLTDWELVVRLTETPAGPIALYRADVWESDADALARPPVWSGVAADNVVRLPRFVGDRDGLYRRILLADAAGHALGSGHYPTDFPVPEPAAPPLPQPATIKGLQCVTDLDDALSLGVGHVAINVSLPALYDPTGASPVRREVDGTLVAVREVPLRRLDATVKRLTNAGVRVTLILLNHLPSRPGAAPPGPLVHPRTDRAVPNRIGAFNLTDAAGTRAFRGLVEALAERYSRPDAAFGLVAGYIVGNEVQSHGDWYNLGPADAATVVAEYVRAVRVADVAVRRFQPDARVFVSLDHHWTASARPDPTRSLPGRELLDRLHAALAAEGDIPWGVAFHPYPENLGDPRTWLDATATPDADAPRVTFKNLEVLVAYLRRPRLRFRGEPRRLILSEQGFHCRPTTEGEVLQAAAFAYAYQRVRQVGGVESFIYHRHVDHPGEGGLRLGLRENVPGTNDRPGRTRPIYDVFRRADEPGAFDFARDILPASHTPPPDTP